MPRSLAIALVVVACELLAADVRIFTVERPVLEERFGRIQSKNEQRGTTLRSMFAEVGCVGDAWMEQKVKGSKLPNLICMLPGTSERQVIVTAHYDQTGGGQGAIDNWSGASLLPSLYQSLKEAPRTLSFVFVLTTDEEKGLVGSSYFVRQLTKPQQGTSMANVNIDSIGLEGKTLVWASRADPKLVNDVVSVAAALKLPVGPMNIDQVGESDSRPFVDEKIPVIDFHSLTAKTLTMLHTKKDIPSELNGESYYNTYRLISTFLAYLDAQAGVTPCFN
ncbi:MAG: M28 family peptidase [Acidobacteriota bacterium]